MAAMAAMMLITKIVERISTFIFWIIAGIEGLKNLADVFLVESPLNKSLSNKVHRCKEKRIAEMEDVIKTYIAKAALEVQDILRRVGELVLEVDPGLTQTLSYQMPTFKKHGKPILYFAA